MRMRSIASALLFFSCGALGLRAQVTWSGGYGLNWSNTLNWSPNAAPDSGTADVTFTNPSIISVVDLSYTLNSLTIGSSVNSLTLSNTGGATLTINNSSFTDSAGILANVLVEVPLSGNMSLNVNGAGTLTLSAAYYYANSYSGYTIVTAGVLADENPYAFSDNSQLFVGSGGTVNVNFPEQVLSLSDNLGYGGSVVIASGATLVMNGGYTSTFSGAISGAGGIEMDIAGTLILTGTNTYTGTTVIGSNAAIQIGNGGTTGSIASNSIASSAATSSTPSALSFKLSTPYTYAGALSGWLNVVQAGTGTTTLSGNNTYSGPTTVNSGTLTAGSNFAFGGASYSNVTVNGGGILDLGSYSDTVGTISGAGAIHIASEGLLTIGNPSGDNHLVPFSGVISGQGALSTGAYITELTGSNTYTGGTTITAGTLLAENTVPTGSATGTGPITISSGGALQIGNLNDTNGYLDPSDNITVNGTGTVSFSRGDTFIFANNIYGNGNVGQYGTGTAILSGTNTYSGTTTVFRGTLEAGSNNAFGSGPVTVYGTLNLYDAALLTSYDNTVGDITGDGAIQLGSATLTTNTTTSTTFSGVISGTGSFVVAGSGDLTLTGNNSYSGGTNISSGTLTVGDGTTLGARIVGNILNNSTLELQPASTDSITYTGNITGYGELWLNGTGTIVLNNSNNNTYSGLTKFDGGTLADGATNSFSPNSSVEMEPGTTLAVNFNETIGDLENGCSGAGTVTIATGKTLTIGNGNSALAPFTGTISGGGGIIIATTGSNSQGFGGASNYTGGTTMNGGEIFISSSTVGAPGSIASGPIGTNTLVFAGNGELSSLGTTITLANAINLNGFNLDNDDATTNVLRLTGLISGSVPGSGGSITWCTPNGLALDNSNTFSGGVDMREGTLLLGSNTGAGAADMNGTSTITLETATLTADGTGMTLNIANPINITGTSQFGNYDNNNITLSGNITGITGSLTYAGGSTGHLTLTGSNTVSIDGYFTIASGTVNAGSNSAFGYFSNQVELTGGAGLNVMSGVTIGNPLAFTGSANGLSGDGTISSAVIAGGSTVINPSGSNGNGPGILTFSNASTNGLTLASGSAIHFDLYDANGAAGTGYGLISDTSLGGLAITAIPSSITFNIVTTDISGNAANALNFNPANPYSWTFATSTNPITGFNSADFNIITSGFTNNFAGGGFSISEVGNNLDLNFTPVPEPSTWALLGGGVLVLVPIALRRRRLRKA